MTPMITIIGWRNDPGILTLCPVRARVVTVAMAPSIHGNGMLK